MAENRVHFGLKNVYYAKITYASGIPSWGTPVKCDGAVNLDLSKETGSTDFYADDVKYFHVAANNGYSGSLEMASFSDQMRQDIWGDTVSSTGKLLIEDANADPAEFALMFEIDGDDKADRFCMLRVSADRPGISSSTKADTIEVKTQSCDVSIMPVVDPSVGSVLNGKVFYRTTSATPTATYDAFYSAVSTTLA